MIAPYPETCVSVRPWARSAGPTRSGRPRGIPARLAWITVAGLVASTAIGAIAYFVDEEGGAAYAITMIVGSLPVAVIIWFLAWHYFADEFHAPGETGLGVTGTTGKSLVASVSGGVVLAALAVVMTDVFPPQIPLEESPLAPLVSNGKVVMFSWLLSSVLVAPLAEEMFFRGVLLGSLSRRWGFAVSATVSTGAFALIHVPQVGGYHVALVPIALLGFAAATARRVFASLWAAIALHAAYNLTLSLYALLS